MSNSFAKRPASTVLAGTVPVVLLLASGCADNIVYTPLKAPPRALSPHPAAAVEVFAVTPPRRPHTDVGIIQVIGANPPPSRHSDMGFDQVTLRTAAEETHEMIAVLRQRAANMGCDAIVVTSVDRKLDWQYWMDQGYGFTALPSVQAACVVYDD